MFLFYSSNERLFRHNIPAIHSSTGLPQSYPSQVEVGGKKRVSLENLEAIRARFLEMFVHKTPKQLPTDLERAGTFERHHFIMGTFDKAIHLLEKYKPSDFHSAYLPAYVLSGLLKNLPLMENTMCGVECTTKHEAKLKHLQIKYNLCP